MANMISNNNNKTNSSTSSGANSSSYAYNNYNNSVSGGESGAGGGVGGGSGRVQTLRDVCNMLMPNQYTIPTGGCAYDHIINLMRDLNLQDDGIVYNTKIKAIETDFCNIVQDETMLCESMEYMNEKALSDSDTALKFALLFSSRNFDALAMKETKVRSAMLKILETNFINADAYRVHDKNRLYNSIILLGEYYNRVRLADHAPITILADSLLNLLIREINDTSVVIGTRLARLVLSQITLNGELMRKTHKEQIDQLLFHVRRHLILQPALTAKVKAMLMMVLDLFYSHFRHIGNELEAMYTDYLVVEEGEEEEDGLNNNQNGGDVPSAQIQEGENGNKVLNSSQEHDSFDSQPTSTKKWSEQVCEDSFCETEGTGADDDQYDNENLVNSYAASSSSQGRPDSNTRGRRTYQPRSAPRPLKQQQLDQQSQDNSTSDQYPSMASSEDRDESKPLPSWRKTRFNRVNNDAGDQHNGRSRNQQRRFSASFDDDQHSVRSEGGPNLRLYSIQDRRKHSQERYERNQVGGLGSNYNSIVNSNWDQRDRDDRSERSYISNYERGNSYKRGGRYNNRNTYDKPPRFQKQQQQQQQQHHHHGQSGGHKIHSDTWRRSNTAVNAYQDENCAYNSNGPDSNSRSSSRARTLPRPAKSQMDDGGRKSNYRFSQSPSHAKAGGSAGSGAQHSFPRYSSQSSLASEASSTFDRRQQHHSHQQPQRHRNFTRRSQPDIHQPQNAGSWQHESPQSQSQSQPSSKDESELVRNAQQTTKYMNYLSAQK